MGLLSPEYYQKALSTPPPRQPVQPTPAPVAQPQAQPQPQQTTFEKIESGLVRKFEQRDEQAIANLKRGVTTQLGGPMMNQTIERPIETLSEEEQIKRYGGVVGSPEYFMNQEQPTTGASFGRSFRNFMANTNYKALQILGVQLPDRQTWDKMADSERTNYSIGATANAAGRLAVRLPRQTALAPIRAGYSAKKMFEDGYNSWQDLKNGTNTLQSADEQTLQVPILGNVNSYAKDYSDMRNSGMGPVAASFLNTLNIVGDVAVSKSLTEAIKTGLSRPRIVNSKLIDDVAPVKNLLTKEAGTAEIISKPKSTSEYYSLPQNIAKKNGGTSQNTYLKISPNIIDDTVEVSIVQTRTGLAQKLRDKISPKGSLYKGDFGPEIKLTSEVVPIKGGVIPEMATGKIVSHGTTPEALESIRKGGFIMGKNSGIGEAVYFSDSPKTSSLYGASKYDLDVTDYNLKTFSSPKEQFDFIKEQGAKNLADAIRAEGTYDGFILTNKTEGNTFGITNLEKLNEGVLNPKAAPFKGDEFATPKMSTEEVQLSIPTKPVKGLENKPVSMEELQNLKTIMEANGIEPSVANAVMKNVTGKSVFSDLSKGEYAEVAQTMAAYDKAAKYLETSGKGLSPFNAVARLFSPVRHWTRAVEEQTGLPVYSQIVQPMEDAVRFRDVFRQSYRQKARDVFGPYAEASQQNSEYRKAIFNYMEGKKDAIVGNPEIPAQVQSDLIVISDKMRGLYDELADQFGIPTEVMLKNYQPHVKNIGGVYMTYKDPAEDILSGLSFFAEFKRTGALTYQIDDALALFDIYANAGSNKKFLNPVLKRASEIGTGLPNELHNPIKSYVGEKLGYGGAVDKFINEVGPVIAQKLGGKLPPDIARKAIQVIMDTTYSAALARPAALVKNLVVNPMLTYARLGSRFYKEGVEMALTKAGRAELQKKGFLIEKGMPYGQELLKDETAMGATLNNYRKLTQTTLAPYSSTDALTRGATYFQTKFQWDEAVDMLNNKKITWDQFEKRVGIDDLSPVDQKMIRTKVAEGDQAGAFDHLVRDVIDETQFPYRRGSSARITYGLGGKIGTQFGQWNIEFLHTMGRWAKTGQWDKLIRFYAGMVTAKRTLEDAFGLSVENWTNAQQISTPTFSPAVQFLNEAMGFMQASKNDDFEEMEKHKDEIFKKMSLLVPAGLQVGALNNFKRSIEAGPDEEGLYPVFSGSGKLKYRANFKDLWWKMMGFPVKGIAEQDKLIKDMANERFDYSKTKAKVLELYQQEKFDQANDLIEEHNIQLSPRDFDAYYIPLTQRSYNSLPAALKPEFAPRVFK